MTIVGLHLSTTLLDLLLLNILLAYAAYPVFAVRRLNLSFMGFAAIGGYTAAVLVDRDELSVGWAIVVGVLASIAIAIPLGLVLHRVSGIYLAIATVNFVLVLQVFIFNLHDLTGGAEGMPGLPIVIDSKLLAVVVVLVMGSFWLLSRTDWGVAIRVQRSDRLLALSAGVNTERNVATLFVVSAALGGLAGALSAFWYGFVSPDSYGFQPLVLVTAMVLLGGSGQWLGPLAGAVFFTIAPEWLRSLGIWTNVGIGVILLLVVVYLPEGIVGQLIANAGLRRARNSRESVARVAGGTA
jgi:branched-chain amino acid transport system permease protein